MALMLGGIAFGAEFDDLVAKGDEYDVTFKSDEALKYYLPAEKLNPNDASLLIKIARQYVFRMDGLGSKAEKVESGRVALSYSERAVKLAPDMANSYLSVAVCWGKLTPLLGSKEKVEASRVIKQSAEKATKLDPSNDYAWHMLGRWHLALSDVGGMVRGIATLVYGGIPDASLEEAERCFKKAIALNPNRLIHYVELGRTYAQMGRKAEAISNLEKGLAMPNQEKDDGETKVRGRDALAKLK